MLMHLTLHLHARLKLSRRILGHQALMSHPSLDIRTQLNPRMFLLQCRLRN